MLDKQQCLFCTESKDKVFSHMRGVKRIYADLEGAEWSGNRCPSCYRAWKIQYDIMRRAKIGHLPLGTVVKCKLCKCKYEIVNGSSNKICTDCKKKS